VLCWINGIKKGRNKNKMPLEDITGVRGVLNIDLSDLKKGQVISNWDSKKEEEIETMISARHMQNFVDDMRKFYITGKRPSKKEFMKIFEKHRKKESDEVMDAIDQLDSGVDNTFRVKSKKKTKKGLVIEFEKVDEKERIRLIKKIVSKLISKLKPEQLRVMLEEGLKQNSDIGDLKKVDKELQKKKPEVKEYRGCFKLVVNGKEIMVLR